GDEPTITSRGPVAWGSRTWSMNAPDAVSYSTFSGSEFAASTVELRTSVPNPMGQTTSGATAGQWGLTLVNPLPTALTVTRIEIDCGTQGLFGPISMVAPATGWTTTPNLVTWNGSVDVSPRDALDFVVRISARSLNRTNIPVT